MTRSLCAPARSISSTRSGGACWRAAVTDVTAKGGKAFVEGRCPGRVEGAERTDGSNNDVPGDVLRGAGAASETSHFRAGDFLREVHA